MGTVFGLILDLVLLIFLAVTLFNVLKLSQRLNAFYRQRENFQKMLADLGRHIDMAYKATERLRQAGNEAGRDLDKKIKDAATLVDELQLMVRSGESLASRMEDSLVNRRSSSENRYEQDEDIEISGWEEEEYEEDNNNFPFSIRDNDLEKPYSKGDTTKQGFSSKAEQELFNALRRKKN